MHIFARFTIVPNNRVRIRLGHNGIGYIDGVCYQLQIVSAGLNDLEIRLSTDTEIPVFQKIYISLAVYIFDKVALILYVCRNIKNDKIERVVCKLLFSVYLTQTPSRLIQTNNVE